MNQVFRQMDMDNIKEVFVVDDVEDVEKVYKIAQATAASTGVVSEWIRRNFKEDEEELARIFKDYIKI